MAGKAVFIDRDGTLIEDPGYLRDPAGVRLLPGVSEAIRSLRQAGYRVVVVTNQSGVARGFLTERTLEAIHTELRRQLAEHGAALDGLYYCPYHPDGRVEGYAVESDLRKPAPGMLFQAARELDIDLSNSWMVGDSPVDIQAGRSAGCRTIRLTSPGSASVDHNVPLIEVLPDHTAADLVEAARIILGQPAKPFS